jgi:hypothetical protein
MIRLAVSAALVAASLLFTSYNGQRPSLPDDLRRAEVLVDFYTPFLELGLQRTRPLMTPFEDIHVNDRCSLAQDQVCILVVDVAKALTDPRLRKHRSLLIALQRNFLALPPRFILVDGTLLNVMLVQIGEDKAGFAKVRKAVDAASNGDLDDPMVLDNLLVTYLLQKDHISYRRFENVSPLLSTASFEHSYELAKAVVPSITRQTFADEFGAGIAWFLFHEVGHLASYRAARSSVMNWLRDTSTNISLFGDHRRQENEADEFAASKMQTFSEILPQEAEGMLQRMSVSSLLGLWRARAITSMLTPLDGPDPPELFFSVTYRPCDDYLKTTHLPPEELPERTGTEGSDIIHEVEMRHFEILTRREFDLLRSRYMSLSEQGTHGFDFERVQILDEQFVGEMSFPFQVLGMETLLEKTLLYAMKENDPKYFVPVGQSLPTHISYQELSRLLKEAISTTGSMLGVEMNTSVEQGINCGDDTERCEKWKVVFRDAPVGIFELRSNQDGATIWFRAHLYVGTRINRPSREHDVQGALGLLAFSGILSSLPALLGPTPSEDPLVSPHFRTHLNYEIERNRKAKPAGQRKPSDGDSIQRVATAVAIFEELRRKTLLCGAGSWSGTNGTERLAISANSSPWIVLEYKIPTEKAAN